MTSNKREDLSKEFIQLVLSNKVDLHEVGSKILAPTGLTGIQVGILYSLDEGKFDKITQYSKFAGLNQGNLSTTIKQLQTAGLISKKRSLDDERKVEIELTKKGTEKLDEVRILMKQFLKTIVDKISTEDLETVLKGFNLLKNILDQIKS